MERLHELTPLLRRTMLTDLLRQMDADTLEVADLDDDEILHRLANIKTVTCPLCGHKEHL